MSTYDDQYYERYKEELRKKYGDEYGYNYVGSALHKRPNLRPEIDAEYLRKKMPKHHIKKKIKLVDAITEDCLRVIEMKAEAGEFSCNYRIKQINPGLPLIYDTYPILVELFKRISKREGIMCYGKDDDTLVITWAPRAETSTKPVQPEQPSRKTSERKRPKVHRIVFSNQIKSTESRQTTDSKRPKSRQSNKS